MSLFEDKTFTNKRFLFLILCLLVSQVPAQQILRYYYPHSRQLYSKEEWNKKHTRAHFFVYYPDGKIMSDGYMVKDAWHGRYKLPDSVFTVYGLNGKVVQQMNMNKDSAVVYTRDTAGFLRGKIFFNSHHCYELQYYNSGAIWSKSECTLPDSTNYYSGYNYYSGRPLMPIDYGEAGYDGVSALGTFKIYYHPDIIDGRHSSVCSTVVYYPGGQPLRVVANERTGYEAAQRFTPGGKPDTDTLGREYYPSGNRKDESYITPQKEAVIYYEWYDNGRISEFIDTKLSPFSFDTSRETEQIRSVVNPAYSADATEIQMFPNGRLASQHTLFITATYDSMGNITNETISNIFKGVYPAYTNDLNTTALLHTGAFKYGMRDGVWCAFYALDTNRLCYKVTYRDGLLTGVAVVYDSLGKLLLQCSVKDSYYDGPLLKMDGGDTVEAVTYGNGLREGLWRTYFKGRLERVDSVNYSGKIPFAEMLLNYHRDPYYKQTERIYNGDTYMETDYYPNGNKRTEVTVHGALRTVRSFNEKGELKK